MIVAGNSLVEYHPDIDEMSKKEVRVNAGFLCRMLRDTLVEYYSDIDEMSVKEVNAHEVSIRRPEL